MRDMEKLSLKAESCELELFVELKKAGGYFHDGRSPRGGTRLLGKEQGYFEREVHWWSGGRHTHSRDGVFPILEHLWDKLSKM